jgi:hypothetical protein
MKHTKEEIIVITQKILEDIQFEYHKNLEFSIVYTESKAVLGRNSNIQSGVHVGVHWYDADYLGGNEVKSFLTIDDDTGEPELFRVRSGGGGNWVIKKDDDGKYFVESNY